MSTSTAPSPPKGPEPLILAAAKSCYLEYGIGKTGMREVAKSAGVARSTLYRYFPSKDDLLVAVVNQEVAETKKLIHKALSQYSLPEDYIVEGIILTLNEIPHRPILYAVFASDEDSAVRRSVWQSEVIETLGNGLMEQVLTPALERSLLQDSVSPHILIEWIYRILLSFLTLPSNWIKKEEELRATLHALLIPVLLKTQATAAS